MQVEVWDVWIHSSICKTRKCCISAETINIHFNCHPCHHAMLMALNIQERIKMLTKTLLHAILFGDKTLRPAIISHVIQTIVNTKQVPNAQCVSFHRTKYADWNCYFHHNNHSGSLCSFSLQMRRIPITM